MNVRTQAGDVFELQGLQLVYGSTGIHLTLTRRNMANIQRVLDTRVAVKDGDSKDRRFIASLLEDQQTIRLEALKGETIDVPVWLLLGDRRVAA